MYIDISLISFWYELAELLFILRLGNLSFLWREIFKGCALFFWRRRRLLPHLCSGCKECSQPHNNLTSISPRMVQCRCRCMRQCWCANVIFVLLWLRAAKMLMAAIVWACLPGAGWGQGLALPPSALASRAEQAPEDRRCSAVLKGAAYPTLAYVLYNPL